MFLRINVFTICIRLACHSQRHERLLKIRYWFTSNHIPFRFGCRPREASRPEAKTHEAEAKTHEAEAEAEATTHEAEAEARFFGLEAEARPRGLTSLRQIPHFQSSQSWLHFWLTCLSLIKSTLNPNLVIFISETSNEFVIFFLFPQAFSHLPWLSTRILILARFLYFMPYWMTPTHLVLDTL